MNDGRNLVLTQFPYDSTFESRCRSGRTWIVREMIIVTTALKMAL
ncbi:hypothetical protein G9444_6545 (plasmid) [Rhodococcus erythropolis]|uniref:Uncharacterized protein n=1 Tax=Rhodococcus erythropolis TaxID=1833 RepID=A0A6G9D3P8_RHOER|nr:hypothetical protein N601_30560 [Rhodococcus erythropolis DN1]QIP43788.1 hypothetical protein G9444_6545 [Rhodococcus erythropolis]